MPSLNYEHPISIPIDQISSQLSLDTRLRAGPGYGDEMEDINLDVDGAAHRKATMCALDNYSQEDDSAFWNFIRGNNTEGNDDKHSDELRAGEGLIGKAGADSRGASNKPEETPDEDADSSEDRSGTKNEYNTRDCSVSEQSGFDPPYTAFSRLQRSVIFAVIIFIGFLGPMAGNIYIPALPILEQDFNVSTTTINTTVSVFMAVFSVGPLLWALHADFGGRKLLYVLSMGLNVIVNVLLAVTPAKIGALFVLRVLQAFASSSALSLGAGTVSDITPPKNRGKAIAYFMLGPNAGPILAPIIAGLILFDNDRWRWLFGFTSIMAGVGFLLVCIFLPETLRCIVGNGDVRWRLAGFAEGRFDDYMRQPKLLLMKNFGIQHPVSTSPEFRRLYPRPPKPSLKTYWEIVKEPNLTICSVSTALMFATYYGFSVTFAHYLKLDYGFSNLAIGACYACPGVALMTGSILGGHISDRFRRKWVAKNPDKTFPSYNRLISQVFGICVSMAGCIGYGWGIQFHYHIAIVLFFSFLMALGMTWCSNSTMTYLTESNPKRAAGTIAVSNSFRNIAAAISSAIIFKLCNVMGVGWCFTGLGLIDLLSMLSVYYLIRNGREITRIAAEL
ncbi:AaceriAGR195Wp [[Ashbya] aceris (nom. inval.)]|nr:AaceriAGR195Wp [[Ashbya] aceris (nom. inval.)]